MLMRQSSSRNHRGKRLWPRHSFQAFLLLAVGVWLVYQLSHSYGMRRAVVVEADDGEPVRRRLGRKGFVDFAGVAFEDGVVGAASSDDPLSEAGDGEGVDSEEDQEADEDDGVDDADDGLAADEEGDTDFQSQDGNSLDELNAEHSETDGELGNGGDGAGFRQPSEVNSSAVPRANPTGRVQDGAATVLRMAPKNTSFQGNDRKNRRCC